MGDRTEYLTVREVMAHLRLGRTTVYAQARRYLETGGAEGLPCRRFGRSLRFPLAELDAAIDPAPAATSRPPTKPRAKSRPTLKRATRTPRPAGTTRPAVQSELPFNG